MVLGLAVLSLTATQAVAATTVSQATANAIGGNLVNTGTCAATNDGTQPSPGTQTGPCTVGGPGTSSGALLSAGVLVADAIATNVGSPTVVASSFACGGVTGPGGGAVQIGPSDPCTVTNGTGQGVNLLGNIITADAIYATCSDVNGVLTGASTLANVAIGGPLATLLPALGVVTGLGTLPLNPLVNLSNPISLSLLGTTTPLLTIDANKQTTVGGQLTVTALDVKVLPGLVTLLPLLGLTNGLEISIGTVTCGPNATIAAVSVIPTKGIPIALGMVAVAGGAAWFGRRRLFASDPR
jgi:hypothetical protein